MDFLPSIDFARELDARDPLAGMRSRFVIDDPDLIYLDGNSLGRLTQASSERMREVVDQEWGRGLIRGWNKGWWQAPTRIGDKIGRLVGASAGQVLVCDTVSANLFKLAAAALELRPERNRIVTDMLNFPSDLYILDGLARMLSRARAGSGSEEKDSLLRVGSQDGDITPDLEELASAIDDRVALVTLSHVTFKSGYMYEMDRITEMAHAHGALVLWDLSHSVGAVSVALDKCQADFAIGCTYKYLNGGPGAPAFLYVRKDLQNQARSPITGWWGQKDPFEFGLDYAPAPGIARFLSGTQPMLSMLAMEAALDPFLEVGIGALRAKSVQLSEYMLFLADNFLVPLGFQIGSPRESDRRGSHISLRHPQGYRINRALIDEMNLLPDFRAPDNLRLGLTPLYTSFSDVREGVERIRRVVQEERYLKYPAELQGVT